MKAAYAAAFCLVLAGCVTTGAMRRVDSLIEAGKLFQARELAETLASQTSNGEAVNRRLARIEEVAAAQAENLDFDPVKYFYAQAFLDYFNRKRFARAADSMQQVLSYTLDNEEILEYFDKVELRVEEDLRKTRAEARQLLAQARRLESAGEGSKAIRVAQRALALEPENAETEKLLAAMENRERQARKPAPRKPARPAPPEPAAPPPDPLWLQSRHDSALVAFMDGDYARACRLLRENIRDDPATAQWRRTLEQVANRLPERRCP